jgi:hypothetical protein
MYSARGVAEYCGDVQQMVSIFEQQVGTMREYGKSGVLGAEHYNFWTIIPNCFMGSELQALHPFGKELATLLKSYEGRCTNPSDCEGWYGSADFSATTARFGDGISSKDELHHLFLKSEIISHLQAVVSICLASTGQSSIDLIWLDDLPAPDDPKLHNSWSTSFRFANTRVLIAEVLELQGRYKEAVRCVSSRVPFSAHLRMYADALSAVQSLHSFSIAELQADFNWNAASKVRAGHILGRCHAALGEHALSVSAFDAAIELAKRGRFLLSEALLIRDRALAGQGASKGTPHWDEHTAKQRLAEVAGRMQGPREPLGGLLGIALQGGGL